MVLAKTGYIILVANFGYNTKRAKESNIAVQLKNYTERHSFAAGMDTCETVLEQLYQAYREAYDFDPPEIKEGFEKLDKFLEDISVKENNRGFQIVCNLCFAYERQAFINGVLCGAHLMLELYQGGKGTPIDTPGAVV